MADDCKNFTSAVFVPTSGSPASVTIKVTSNSGFGYTADDPVDQTNNANTAFNSFCEGAFITKDDVTVSGHFLMSQKADFKAAMNQQGVLTITNLDTGNLNSDTVILTAYNIPDVDRATRPTITATFKPIGEDAAGVDDEVITIGA